MKNMTKNCGGGKPSKINPKGSDAKKDRRTTFMPIKTNMRKTR
jgi:hypothetical protein